VIAYLMKKQGLPLLEAYRYVKERREVIQPNVGFMKQLKEFETTLGLTPN